MFPLHTHTHTHRVRVSKNRCEYNFPIIEGGLEGWSLILFRKFIFLTSFWFSDSTDITTKTSPKLVTAFVLRFRIHLFRSIYKNHTCENLKQKVDPI